MREIDVRVVQAQTDDVCLEALIKDYETYILGTAFRITGTYINKSDDRWSVSLSAFHEAVISYDYNRGSFLFYAETVIRHRLYDYERKERRETSIAVDPTDLSDMGGVVPDAQSSAVLEIEAVKLTLAEYKIAFSDLVAVSPKAEKTKDACARAIGFIIGSPILIAEMHRTKMLPIRIIEKNTGITPKILERHRKYIIAGIVILSGEYPILAEYFRRVKEGTSR